VTRLAPVNHLAFSLVHFAGSGQHQFAGGDKSFGNVAPFGECYSPLHNTSRRTEVRVRKDAGIMVISDPS
jgi:hypothetical protein